MPTETLDAVVRRIVREELAALVTPPPPEPEADPGEDVARFLATLRPGESAGAADLYLRWMAWAGAGESAHRLTGTAFGRLVMKSGMVDRTGVGRRFYARRYPGRGGCVGAPDCDRPMVKMSDRCAEHQLPKG